jgi:hypothetical protein
VTHQEAAETLATERYLLNEMPESDREAFEEHFFDCERCADDVRTAAAMLQGAKAGFAGRAAPGRVVPMVPKRTVGKVVWYRSAALPWAAAATLALTTAYQSLWVVPSLRRETAPTALAPITLRPASRGAEASVRPASSRGPVTLALEINEPATGELAWTLTSSDGRQIVAGRAPAPAPGTPLLLMMPSWTLVGPMHYILSVHEAGPSGRSLGEYRFMVSPE